MMRHYGYCTYFQSNHSDTADYCPANMRDWPISVPHDCADSCGWAKSRSTVRCGSEESCRYGLLA
eukprot:89997-Pyramimonas_sp.AAC.1